MAHAELQAVEVGSAKTLVMGWTRGEGDGDRKAAGSGAGTEVTVGCWWDVRQEVWQALRSGRAGILQRWATSGVVGCAA